MRPTGSSSWWIRWAIQSHKLITKCWHNSRCMAMSRMIMGKRCFGVRIRKSSTCKKSILQWRRQFRIRFRRLFKSANKQTSSMSIWSSPRTIIRCIWIRRVRRIMHKICPWLSGRGRSIFREIRSQNYKTIQTVQEISNKICPDLMTRGSLGHLLYSARIQNSSPT